MSRIKELFEKKKTGVVNVYFTAGFPGVEDTVTILHLLEKYSADIIELGMPYSDPLADGPVIQQSSSVALANGMTVGRLFTQLEGFREKCHLPVILMGYMNTVLQYGFERFCADAAARGIDGLILPDLPLYEFQSEYGKIIRDHGLDFIFLVTPETSVQRIRELDAHTSGFLYAVSSSSTTGQEKSMGQVEEYLSRLQQMNLANPVLVGFGMRTRQDVEMASRYANGAIIGSAFIKALETSTSLENSVKAFMEGVRPA